MKRRFRTSRYRQTPSDPGQNPGLESFELDTPGAGDISASISENENRIREAFGNSADLVIRKIKFGAYSDIQVLVVHIDGLVDDQMVIQSIIRPINFFSEWPPLEDPTPARVYNQLKDRLIAKDELSEVGRMEDLLKEVCSGNSAILVDGYNAALIVDVKGWKERNIEPPTTEPTVRGSKEGFVENLRTNTSIIRKNIRSPRLRVEELTIGAVSRHKVAIIYIDGIANNNVVQEIRDRISRISIDAVQGTGVLEEYIEDSPYSPFPTVLRTERPDRAVGSLLEGRVVVLNTQTPFVLIVPCDIFMFLSAPDDYFERYFIGSFLRLLRIILFVVSLLLPSLYVALVTFHQEMIPTELAVAIAAQREGIPFPVLVEALILEIAFEMLRETTARVPLMFGPAVSILGVLFLGQAAVQAGLTSPFIVIIVSITGIASLGVPIFSLGISIRLLRFVLLILGGTLGLYGITWGIAALLIHLASLRSYGVPYAQPILPLIPAELKDSIVRFPWWSLLKRPHLVAGPNTTRQGSDQKPGPPPPPDNGPQGGS